GVVAHVAVRPRTLAAVFGDEAQQAAVGRILPDAGEVGIKQVADRRRQELPQAPPDALLGPVAERLRRGGIDRQQHAVEVMNAHEPQAVLDQQAIEVVPFLEGVLDSLVLVLEGLQLRDELGSGLVQMGHPVPPFLARQAWRVPRKARWATCVDRAGTALTAWAGRRRTRCPRDRP